MYLLVHPARLDPLVASTALICLSKQLATVLSVLNLCVNSFKLVCQCKKTKYIANIHNIESIWLCKHV